MAEMMAEPRSGVKYDNLLPDDEGWGQAEILALDIEPRTW
jgi:hypothetical protein